MEILLQIVNGTNIPFSDPNTANLVYATWAVAIATLIGIIITTLLTRSSLKETRRSNSLLTLELKTKFKPRLSFTRPQLRHKPDEISTANFSCMITNTGNVALSNISIYYFPHSSKILPHKLLTNESIIKKTELKIEGTFEPSHNRELSFVANIDTRNDMWIAIWLNYEYLDDIREEAVTIFYFKTQKGSGGFESLDATDIEWFTHNNIQKTRKEFTENKGTPSSGI